MRAHPRFDHYRGADDGFVARAWPRSAGAEWLASRPWPQVWSEDEDEDWVLVATTMMRMEYDGMRMRMKMMVMKAMLLMLIAAY